METKRKTTTSAAVKNRYNDKTYKTYKMPVRKDSELYVHLENLPKGEFANLARTLLEQHFKNNLN